MTKIVVLGDTHFGARNSNKIVEHWQERFFNEVFWPYVEDNSIKTVIQLGDWFDNRKWINLQTMAFQKRVFVERVQQNNIQVHTIIGNHDIPFRHSLDMSSPVQILGHEPNFTVWDNIGKITIDDVTFTMLPWICNENEVDSLETISAGGDILVGHLEIAGFNLHGNHKSLEGLPAANFTKWNKVWSGHYHTQSQNGNINYMGTPYQMSWNDYMPKCGFWVFDTHDRSETFINNPLRYFHRIDWNDGYVGELQHIANSYVKLTVKKKTDFEAFEKFVDQINFHNPYELKIVESFEEFNSDNVAELIKLSTTEELISEYIDDVATHTDKEKVKLMMHSIYEEAIRMENEQ